MRRQWLAALDLRRDQRDPESISEAVHSGVAAVGTNLWVLIFAIMVASIGLNMNSTAVVIGAMLISPLMGPIVGVGFGAATNDFPLLRKAFQNLAVMVVISLLTATLYFSISPLREAHSELLARTTPSLWDVLIAFSGGAAGIVALTRRSISNAVPGVAIATALMPPLCTAGYGLATQRWDYFAGAMFLFVINGVFIAMATLLFAKLMRLPQMEYVDEATRRKKAALIWIVVVAILIPSAWFGWKLVEKERFEFAANSIVAGLSAREDTLLLAREVRPEDRYIELTIANGDPEAIRLQVARQLSDAGYKEATIRIRSTGSNAVDTNALRQELQQDLQENLYAQTFGQLEQASARVKDLEGQLEKAEEERGLRAELLTELHAQFPEASTVSVTTGEGRYEDGDIQPVLWVRLVTPAELDPAEVERLRLGWNARFTGWAVKVASGPAALSERTLPPAETVIEMEATQIDVAPDLTSPDRPAP